MNTTTRPTSLARSWARGTSQLRARRAQHAADKRLESELAGYSTPAERMELNALLARHEYTEVADIHRIVDRHRVA